MVIEISKFAPVALPILFGLAVGVHLYVAGLVVNNATPTDWPPGLRVAAGLLWPVYIVVYIFGALVYQIIRPFDDWGGK